MPDPLMINAVHAGQVTGPTSSPGQVGPTTTPDGKSFKDLLLDSLDQVNRLQKEADDGVEKVITGETDNVAEVFSAVRKSEVAFSMLMEMRNKLVEAYQEVQQLRV